MIVSWIVHGQAAFQDLNCSNVVFIFAVCRFFITSLLYYLMLTMSENNLVVSQLSSYHHG